MSREVPFVRVVAYTGNEAVNYDNAVAPTNPTFMKVKEVVLMRNATNQAKNTEITLNNDAGTYNGNIVPEDLIDVWINPDEAVFANAQKVFRGRVKSINRDFRSGKVATMRLICRDVVSEFLQTHVRKINMTPGSAWTDSFGNSTTINDFADIVRAILKDRYLNPRQIAATNVSNVGQNIQYAKSWNHIPVFQVLQEVAQLGNADFFVDATEVATFRIRNSVTFENGGAEGSFLFTTDEATSLTRAGLQGISEVYDFEMEKSVIKAFCGQTSDGTAVLVTYHVPGARTRNPKTAWVRNIRIAPGVAGGDASTRLTNARNQCREFARAAFERNKVKRDFELSLQHYYNVAIGDLIRVTSADMGLTRRLLKITGIKETLHPREAYSAAYTCTIDTGIS